jgi:hypothetical protein
MRVIWAGRVVGDFMKDLKWGNSGGWWGEDRHFKQLGGKASTKENSQERRKPRK